jgi:hypothetical protein
MFSENLLNRVVQWWPDAKGEYPARTYGQILAVYLGTNGALRIVVNWYTDFGPLEAYEVGDKRIRIAKEAAGA